MIEEPTTPFDGGPSACPFVAFEDDRDHRSSSPDYRHRCFAAPEPEPRAFPHQERYCLSAAFAGCPIFLDWARQEAAAVKVGGAAAAAALFTGAAGADFAGSAAATDDDTAPAFLAARPPATVSPVPRASSRHAADVSAGLWSYEGDTKASKAPAAPLPPSSLGAPAVVMARRGPSHPGWENPPRLESFPRLRSREDRRANQPLFFVAVGAALVMVALALFPIITSKGSGAGASRSAPLTSGSGSDQSALPSDDLGSPSETFFHYTIQRGDQMWIIAARFNLKTWELELANPQIKDFNHLEVGWVINVPPPGLETEPASPSAS